MTGKYSSRNKIKNLKFLRPGLQADLCKTAVLPLREEYVHSSQYQKILYQVVKVSGMGEGMHRFICWELSAQMFRL